MSLNPEIGHLYHDGYISNMCITLDVKEKLRTREINARESKYLDKYSHGLDRAKAVCRRRNEWEQRCVRNQLKNIKLKTPSLTESLRRESEREQTRQRATCTGLVLPNVHGKHTTYTMNDYTYGGKEIERPVFVSSWSVYSNRMLRYHSAPAELDIGNSSDEVQHVTYRYSLKGGNRRSKMANNIKKTEQVAKTLHKLYTQNVERKRKEQNMTVLDVLGKESKEELEKALFVLRGTIAGDAIEDILKERERVYKQQEGESVETKMFSMPNSNEHMNRSNDVFVTQINNNAAREVTEVSNDAFRDVQNNNLSIGTHLAYWGDGREGNEHCKQSNDNMNEVGTLKPTLYSNTVPIQSDSSDSMRFTSSDKLLYKRWKLDQEMTNVNEVFERDATWMMSSTLGNASDNGPGRACLRWTDLFKAPELWKQKKTGNVNNKHRSNALTVVTLTGKRRHTMLNR